MDYRWLRQRGLGLGTVRHGRYARLHRPAATDPLQLGHKPTSKGLFRNPPGWPENSPLWASTLDSYRVIWLCHRRLTPRYRATCRRSVSSKRCIICGPPRKSRRSLKQSGGAGAPDGRLSRDTPLPGNAKGKAGPQTTMPTGSKMAPSTPAIGGAAQVESIVGSCGRISEPLRLCERRRSVARLHQGAFAAQLAVVTGLGPTG